MQKNFHHPYECSIYLLTLFDQKIFIIPNMNEDP